jgi:hypothetical protein
MSESAERGAKELERIERSEKDSESERDSKRDSERDCERDREKRGSRYINC